MDDTVEDVFSYIPSIEGSILKESDESIWIVQDVEDYLKKYDISNKIEEMAYYRMFF